MLKGWQKNKILLTYLSQLCGCGEIGRRAGLRILWATVGVQVPSSAPSKNKTNLEREQLSSIKFVLFFNSIQVLSLLFLEFRLPQLVLALLHSTIFHQVIIILTRVMAKYQRAKDLKSWHSFWHNFWHSFLTKLSILSKKIQGTKLLWMSYE